MEMAYDGSYITLQYIIEETLVQYMVCTLTRGWVGVKHSMYGVGLTARAVRMLNGSLV